MGKWVSNYGLDGPDTKAPSSEVRLWLSALACNLGNPWETRGGGWVYTEPDQEVQNGRCG